MWIFVCFRHLNLLATHVLRTLILYDKWIYDFFHTGRVFLLTWKRIIVSMNKMMGIFSVQRAVKLLGRFLTIRTSAVNYQLPPCFTLSYCPAAQNLLRYYLLTYSMVQSHS